MALIPVPVFQNAEQWRQILNRNFGFLNGLRVSAATGTVTINAGAYSIATVVTVPGAVVGNTATASCSVSTTGLFKSVDVTAADTVTIGLYNPTAGNITLTNPTWSVIVNQV